MELKRSVDVLETFLVFKQSSPYRRVFVCHFRPVLLVILLAIATGSANTWATPLQWAFQDVRFDDGTAVLGSFTYDADFNIWTAWDFSVQDGVISGFNYTETNSHINQANANSFGVLFEENGFSRYINFNFLQPMTNVGGAIGFNLDYDGSFQSAVWECDFCDNVRYALEGSIIAPNSTTRAVPEPGVAAMLGLGLFLFGITYRKD